MTRVTTSPILPSDTRLAVVMACHNRRDKTLACLAALRAAADAAQIPYALYLFDDGSRDGTTAAVLEAEPGAIVLHGEGHHYWNRGMHAAFALALRRGHAAYLWLNDDTVLHRGGIDLLCATLVSAGAAIVVGAVRDPLTGRLSYGGSRRVDPRRRPFRARTVEPGGLPEPVDMFNGNVVLIPETVAVAMGNLDPVFEHAMGDTDYALRARRAGIPILQTGAFVADCVRNSTRGTLRDPATPLRHRLRDAFSRKGLPPRSWLLLCRRHAGAFWPLHFIWGYTKVVLARAW